MSAKILVVFLCAAVGTAAGYFVMRTYKRSFNYLDGVCKMIGELKRNISYRRDTVAEVLCAMQTDSALLKKNVEEYLAFVGGKSDKPTISRGYLSAETHARISELFGSIGRTDGGSQIDQLNAFDDTFKKLRDAAEQKCKKYGTVAVKLGFLLGLGVGVLTL